MSDAEKQDTPEVNDELESQFDSGEIVEEPEAEDTDSELASEPDEDQEKETDEADEHRINQEKINAVINKKHREKMEALEEAERLRKQLQQYESTSNNAPEVPELPDPFDDDYDKKLSEYRDSVFKRAKWEAEQEAAQKHEAQRLEQQQREQLEQVSNSLQTYTKRAEEIGISAEELQKYGNDAGQYLNLDMQLAIVNDEDGALITKYLAQNPLEAQSLSQMNPYQAALHLERGIRPKAQALKPRKSNAPKPPQKVVGGANIEEGSPYLKGAEFS